MTLCLSQIEQQLQVSAPAQEGDGWTFKLGIEIRSESNQREHWRMRHNRVKLQRATVGQALWARELLLKRERPQLPLTVRFTRLAARKLDSDNLVGGFKACRDEVASWLGVNDNDPRVTWEYQQAKGKGFAARIEIVETKDA